MKNWQKNAVWSLYTTNFYDILYVNSKRQKGRTHFQILWLPCMISLIVSWCRNNYFVTEWKTPAHFLSFDVISISVRHGVKGSHCTANSLNRSRMHEIKKLSNISMFSHQKFLVFILLFSSHCLPRTSWTRGWVSFWERHIQNQTELMLFTLHPQSRYELFQNPLAFISIISDVRWSLPIDTVCWHWLQRQYTQ